MTLSPKQLFLVDGLGACVSAFSLGIVLPAFDNLFAMPKSILYFLALIPCFFAIYSFLCFLSFPEKWQPYLKRIAIANTLYCILSIGMVLYFQEKVSNYDWAYFILEIIVIGILVRLELKAAS